MAGTESPEGADRNAIDSDPKRGEVRVPVIEEGLMAGTREVKTGSIRVRKRVQRIPKRIEMPVIKDALRFDRVPVNRVIKAIPQIREEGEVLVVPVVEERIIVSRRLVLKEEIRITRKQVEQHAVREVSVAREQAIVERLDESGNVIARSGPAESQKRHAKKSSQFFREKGLV